MADDHRKRAVRFGGMESVVQPLPLRVANFRVHRSGLYEIIRNFASLFRRNSSDWRPINSSDAISARNI